MKNKKALTKNTAGEVQPPKEPTLFIWNRMKCKQFERREKRPERVHESVREDVLELL
jgi:hypothetical protein